MIEALVVDDDTVTLLAISEAVKEEGFSVRTATCVEEARKEIAKSAPDLLLLDVMLPDGNGFDLLENLDDRSGTEVVLITAHGSQKDSLEALQLGASNYLTKPVSIQRLKSLLADVVRAHDVKKEMLALKKRSRDPARFGPLLGHSPQMRLLYEQITKAAPADVSVLITGESGTGKELVAQTLHEFSRRRKKPFLPVNCGAISPTLIESEIFGHEQGSFTGAGQMHRGHFERASGGTLFLDEITEMPIELQVKLLRVLETGTIVRVGGDDPIEVDVRVIAATNSDPEDAVAQEKLRKDLLYRLNVFPINVPPLRDREDDVELLAGSFLAERNKAAGTSKKFSKETRDFLRSYRWPGNVRELKNAIHRAFIMADEVITPRCLPMLAEAAADRIPELRFERREGTGKPLDIEMGMSLKEAQKRLILATLESCDGNKKETAKALGISLRTLYNRLNAYRGGENGGGVDDEDDEE